MRRRTWRQGGRAHIEVRGASTESHAALRHALKTELSRLDAVHWVDLVGATGHLVVDFDEDEVDLADIVEIVDEAEAAVGVTGERFAEHGRDHPADWEPLAEEVFAFAADTAALGVALAGRAARLARLPVEVASIVPLVQSQPRLRHLLEDRLPTQGAHLALAVVDASAHALAQGPLGLAVDGALHATLASERFTQRRQWAAVEGSLHSSGDATSPPPPDAGERPEPLSGGPVEVYADRAGIASVGGFGVALATTRSWRRAGAALLAGMPKAATMGREAFAAHIGRVLTRRDAIVLDRRVLRLLDRIDCVVVDRSIVVTDANELVEVVPLIDEEVEPIVVQLFDPDGMGRVRRRGVWRLGRLDRMRVRTTARVRRALLQIPPGEQTFALARGDTIAALARVRVALDPRARTVVDAARAAGHMVAVAGVESDVATRLGADLQVDGDDGLLGSVRMLQGDGCGVVLVSAVEEDALRAADCGVGVMTDDRPVPYAADVLCDDIDVARFLVAASSAAYEASRQSVALALAGSSVGGLLVMIAPSNNASARAMTAVNSASLAALVNGTRVAMALDRRPAPVVRSSTAWHALTRADVLERLGTTNDGLAGEQPEERRPALPRRIAVPAVLTAIGSELVNPFTPVLAAAAGLSAATGSVLDAGLISSVAGINAVLGGVQRHRVESAIRRLEIAEDRPVRVQRDGETQSVPAADVVTGDVVILEAGDAVPADCRVLDAINLEADESSLTGESMPVTKQVRPVVAAHIAERSSLLYAGTTIAAGRGRAAVVAVGDQTEMGKAATGDAKASGGVEARLRQLTKISLPVTLGGGALLAGANFVRGAPLASSLQAGTSLAVAAVPEGLPMLATAAQLSAARRLASRGALVRNPRSVEALGRVDVLCTDKTGTLTQGRITLQRVSDGRHGAGLDALDERLREVLAAGVRASPRQRPGRVLPHPTDRAVVNGAAEAGVGPATDAAPWQKQAELPFEPTRGYHAVVGTIGDATVLSVKGAPEVVLPRCDTWLTGDAKYELDDATREQLTQTVEAFAQGGLRVLAVAERPASDRGDLDDERVARLQLLGFLALADPVRSTAAIAVEQMQEAGVSVVMVTGDHPSTAEGIAGELGILNGHRVVTGVELDAMTDGELARVLDDISVFARVTPAHKVRIVTAYQDLGRTVAMTGDGANDAPAIRLADVGVALGERATAAARQTADVVVPDGRIETLIDAVVEGRAMWASVRDALAILLGGNLGEVTFTVLAGLVGGESPLSARQLLLVNLMTDGLPAIAIAVRPPAGRSPDRLLTEGPEASLGRPLELAILHRAGVTAAAGTGAWLLGAGSGRRRRSTMALVGVVGAQLIQTALSGIRDPRVLLTAGGSAAALAVIIETPGVSHLFGCAPIGPLGWAMGAGSAVAATAAGAVIPSAFRRVADLANQS